MTTMTNIRSIWRNCAALAVCFLSWQSEVRGAKIVADVDRSPVDLVVSPDATWLISVNQTSHSLSLVNIASGSVMDEIEIGRRPTAIALLPNGQQCLVSSSLAGEVAIVSVADGKLKRVGAIAVGFEPHGIAVTRDGKRAFVALTAADQVAEIDLATEKIVAKIDVGRWPRYLALAPAGDRLAVGTAGDRGISVVDVPSRKMLFLEQFVGLNIGHLQASADGQKVYFPWMVYRHQPITAGNIRLGWVLGSRIGRVRLDGPARREAISLDPPGKAIADPFGLALSRDEQRLVVTASGTHELLIYKNPALPFKDFGGTDHAEPELLKDKEIFDRVELGGRPMGVRLTSDDRTALVANYLDNSIQEVDLAARKLVRSISLGGAKEPSLVRRGEAIFHDARRSLDQWYSCHSCHYDGGSNSERMDTFNDGTAYTFKTVLPLQQVHETAPFTWHGWQKDLADAAKTSITQTMLGKEPTTDDVDALVAYMRSLVSPPNPFRNADGSLSEAAARGEKIFASEKAGCANCHSGPRYTDGLVHDVGLGSPGDRYKGFNTPTLIGVFRKVRLLHDGRARSLDQVLTEGHNPAKVTGKGSLNDDERRDLIEFLKSL